MEKLENKIKTDYKDLKVDIVSVINDTLEDTSDEHIKIDDLLSFIENYISKGKDSNLLNGLIDDNDIFNFYLKHQSDIDDLLNKTGYLKKSPTDNNVFSLYDIIMDGTKQSIVEVMELLKKEVI